MTAPAVFLIRPQLVENIGTTARAMLNCNLTELGIVDPRDAWPLPPAQSERMRAAASGADSVLENAKVFGNLSEALKGFHTVFATTARARDMVKTVYSPRAAIANIHTRIFYGEKIALLFGPERTGLHNDDLQFCENLIHIPANPEFSSFNLAQSVLILAYEWLMAKTDMPDENKNLGHSRPATKEDLINFFDHLERELEVGGFFTSPQIRPTMVQNIRNAILRAELTEQEVRTWHGMVKALARGPFKAESNK